MTLSTGTKLGPYEIVSPLGKGGMGEVYRARDSNLDREVAIKVLPDFYARDPERIARFQREAKALASLNHPNIAAIYGFEESGDKRFLVMELVEGETLADRLRTGAIPTEESLHIGKQIAEALEAAHQGGVIHRDLKPANVKVTPDGQVKVLDFGLAKAFSGDPTQTNTANSPTITADHTLAGTILGTAAYMSPEQARGRPVDKRTDIWAFGCVLYECITGSVLFGGDSVADSLGAILHKDPDWSRLPPDTPAITQLLLRRCLTKDRKRRLQDIGDARIDLEDAIADPTSSSLSLADAALTDADRRKKSRRVTPAIWLVGLALLVVGAAISWYVKPAGNQLGRILAEIPPPEDGRILFAGDIAGPAVVSPDGSKVAFAAKQPGGQHQLWLRDLTKNKSRALQGTNGAVFPFWSTDSRSIGFFVPGQLKRIDLTTGTTASICDATDGRGGTWLTDDVILFSPDFQASIHRVAATGGTPRPITEVDKSKHTSHRWPATCQDGIHFLYSAVNHNPSKSEHAGIYLGSVDGADPQFVIQSQLNAEYALGQLLFVRDNVLMAVPLDLSSGDLTGNPVAIARGVAIDLSTWRAASSVSPAGVLTYHNMMPISLESGAVAYSVAGVGAEANVSVLYSREGRPKTQVAEGIPQTTLRLSPDGKRLAIGLYDERPGGIDLWIYDDTNTGVKDKRQRVTFLPFQEVNPVWSPDGTELAFAHMYVGVGKDAIYRKRIGGGVEELLVEASGDDQIWPLDWSADGKYLAYATGRYVGSASTDIWILPLDGSNPVPYLATEEGEWGARFSPNGKWIAYTATVSEVSEVFVVPFVPPTEAGSGSEADGANAGRKWQISVGGGQGPCWRADGKELFYISAGGDLVAVAVNSETDILEVGASTPLFQTSHEPGKSYDVTPDGQTFFMNEVTMNVDTPISIIINWNAELGK